MAQMQEGINELKNELVEIHMGVEAASQSHPAESAIPTLYPRVILGARKQKNQPRIHRLSLAQGCLLCILSEKSCHFICLSICFCCVA